MGLYDSIKDIIKEEGISTKDHFTSYPTGVDLFDYRIGFYDPISQEINTGLQSGKLFTVLGRSGSGKTTFAIQTAGSIVDKYDNGVVLHLDFEDATSVSRIMHLNNWDKETYNSKYQLLKGGISSEKVYSLAKGIEKTKKEKYDDIKIDSGKKDDEGNIIYELPPTVIIIDSVATMFSAKIIEEEQMGGQMDVTAQAKQNNTLIKRLSGSSLLSDANIIIIAINHITTKIDINPMQKTPAAINYLKQDESVPGKQSHCPA